MRAAERKERLFAVGWVCSQAGVPLTLKYPSAGGKEMAKTEFSSGHFKFDVKNKEESYFFLKLL